MLNSDLNIFYKVLVGLATLGAVIAIIRLALYSGLTEITSINFAMGLLFLGGLLSFRKCDQFFHLTFFLYIFVLLPFSSAGEILDGSWLFVAYIFVLFVYLIAYGYVLIDPKGILSRLKNGRS